MSVATDIEITPELIAKHGITPEEYERIKHILGREPNFTELGIFSVMWSEHCSYKNSRLMLRKFPTSGSRVLVKAGEENAGAVDIGNGWAVVFKIESHNHPSAVEPFQGAATGVGGIIRDIFTMGARPIAGMNSLRFGSLKDPQVKHLFTGVVSGISHYGNCIGVPTVGGEITFDPSYDANPLVNVFCLGIARHGDLVKGSAKGPGNPVFYLGATTGRDGLGGAAFASRELTEESQKDRPAVQVGDPFMEKLLLEACLELIKSGAVVGIQDMGAAGLTCSTCETASRGRSGIEIELEKVPKRETGMIPYEIMLSESQERMLVIVHKGREKEVQDIFDKWDLHAVQIGEVKTGTMMRVLEKGRVVGEIPARALAEEGPLYEREAQEPAWQAEVRRLDLSKIAEPKDYAQALKALLADPTIASKHWVWEQYDHMVQDNTVVLPGSDASVLRIKDAGRWIAMSTDCNGSWCFLDPFEGAKAAVAESVRNVVCSGAKPLGITNCLNFGNPMKPEIFWQFRQAVLGMIEALKVLDLPVTGGNVSFYNENPQGAVDPTPVIGTVGLIEKEEHITTQWFKKAGDALLLLGAASDALDASLYLKRVHGLKRGKVPAVDMKAEKALQEALLAAIHSGAVSSAHDLSEGGLAVALAESCFGGLNAPALGAKIALPESWTNGKRVDGVLFGEAASRVLISAPPQQVSKIEALCRKHGVSVQTLGTVQPGEIVIQASGKTILSAKTSDLKDVWNNAIENELKT